MFFIVIVIGTFLIQVSLSLSFSLSRALSRSLSLARSLALSLARSLSHSLSFSLSPSNLSLSPSNLENWQGEYVLNLLRIHAATANSLSLSQPRVE